MNRRSTTLPARDWRDWPHVQPAAETSQRELRIIFALWLFAFLLKHSGSAWDVAWHFRYVFGMFEPPHRLNIVGDMLVGALFAYQILTGKAVERTGFLTMQVTFAIFLFSVPLDFLNHYLFGLDVTVWSPTHVLGFAATTALMCGLLYSWLKLAAPGRWRLAFALICWATLLDDAFFQLGQQEYGVIALDAYARGITSASPELLAQAGRNPEQFVRGGIPEWLYPVWMVLTSAPALVSARRVLNWRWAATAVALIYLGFRLAGRLLLGAFDFPVSFIPVMLLLAAFVIDVSENRRWHMVVTGLVVTAVYYSSAALIGRITLMPAFPLATAPFVCAALCAGLAAAAWWHQRRHHMALQAS
jgi:hypothetical protein